MKSIRFDKFRPFFLEEDENGAWNEHVFRHTHTTMLAEAGAPPKYVQERLGHKGIDVTMKVYQRLTQTLSQRGTVALNDMYR